MDDIETTDSDFYEESEFSDHSSTEDSDLSEPDIPIKNKIAKKGKQKQPFVIILQDLLNIQGLSSSKGKVQKKTNAEKTLAKRLKDNLKEIEQYNKKKDKNLSLEDRVILSALPLDVKSNILERLSQESHESDMAKYEQWVRDLLTIPFGKYKTLDINLDSAPEDRVNFLNNIQEKLDKAVYGQTNSKNEVLDFIARKISNNNAKGNVIALVGSPGVAKTRLARKGIAEALDLPFHQISLGGINDVAGIIGSNSVYVGSKPGRIVEILKQSDCMNPVIYIDELDKVAKDSHKGSEVYGVLTHILDEEQNTHFNDLYMGDINIDLSKVLFIISLNDLSLVDSIVRDRIKIINVPDPTIQEKCVIMKDYILPELNEMMNIKTTISEDTIKYLLFKTENEPGIRKAKKNLETVIQKINSIRIKTEIDINQKYEITKDLVDKYLPRKKPNLVEHMYI
jgi:ATP-dependent Lon protease